MKRIFLVITGLILLSNQANAQDAVRDNAVKAINEAANRASKIVEDTVAQAKHWKIKNNLTFNTEQNMFTN